ncbi:MAG TPA: T9SS type A sorting domain-containing protein, partial [Cytophagales bacterium]|nr:T9SS type A sorting domain-containing protein [Cytophagales bacterium]
VPGSAADISGCGIVTAMKKSVDSKTLSVFPSPCTDILFIELSSLPQSPLQISILSAQGQLVGQQTVMDHKGSVSVPTVYLKSDLYYLKVRSGEEIIFKKFSKVD